MILKIFQVKLLDTGEKFKCTSEHLELEKIQDPQILLAQSNEEEAIKQQQKERDWFVKF